MDVNERFIYYKVFGERYTLTESDVSELYRFDIENNTNEKVVDLEARGGYALIDFEGEEDGKLIIEEHGGDGACSFGYKYTLDDVNKELVLFDEYEYCDL